MKNRLNWQHLEAILKNSIITREISGQVLRAEILTSIAKILFLKLMLVNKGTLETWEHKSNQFRSKINSLPESKKTKHKIQVIAELIEELENYQKTNNDLQNFDIYSNKLDTCLKKITALSNKLNCASIEYIQLANKIVRALMDNDVFSQIISDAENKYSKIIKTTSGLNYLAVPQITYQAHDFLSKIHREINILSKKDIAKLKNVFKDNNEYFHEMLAFIKSPPSTKENLSFYDIVEILSNMNTLSEFAAKLVNISNIIWQEQDKGYQEKIMLKITHILQEKIGIQPNNILDVINRKNSLVYNEIKEFNKNCDLIKLIEDLKSCFSVINIGNINNINLH